jgi:dGTP triphosphohydrolase
MLGQIEQEIAELETAIAKVEDQIKAAFVQYVDAIAQAIQSQLIMSAYKLCTHVHPEQFLQLSLSERQQLQQDLQALGQESTNNIRVKLKQIAQQEQPTHEMVEKLLVQDLDHLSHAANQVMAKANLFNLENLEQLPEDAPRMRLRLTEIELNNREVISHRSELRVLSNRWQQFIEELDRKKQAKLVSQAEHAWRSSWLEMS